MSVDVLAIPKARGGPVEIALFQDIGSNRESLKAAASRQSVYRL